MPMYRKSYQSVFGLFTALLFAAGCSAEQQAQTENEATPQAANAEAVAAPIPVSQEQGYRGAIEGVVRDRNGDPVAGAFVKLKNAERRLTFMHISRDGGRYAATKLPAGSYTVQAIGGDYESAWSAPVAISEDAPGAMDVTLNVERAPDLLPGWSRRSPEYLSTAEYIPDGPAKDIIMSRCTVCHTEQRIISRHVGREEWESILDDMRQRMASLGVGDLPDDDAETIIDFLSTTYPPLPAPDPNSRFPRTLQPADARDYRVVEYDLETPAVETHDIAVDPWGRGWSNQRVGGRIGHFDPVTYEYGEIDLPPNPSGRQRVGNPQITRSGVLWVSEPFGNRWLSYDIAKEEWTEYPFPSDQINGSAFANTMAINPDGTIWGSGPGNVRRLNPETREWDSWEMPTLTSTGINPGGYGITVAGDGRVWTALDNIDRIARVDPDSGEVKEFPIPVESPVFPRRLDHDPAGDVWFALWSAGKVLKVDHTTDEMTVIDPPIPHNGAYSIDFDQTNDIMWINFHTRDIIASYDPNMDTWHLYPMPQAETDFRRVEVDQNNPNRIWWTTEDNQARMGFMELLDE